MQACESTTILAGITYRCSLLVGHTGEHKVEVNAKDGMPVRSARIDAVSAKATFPSFNRKNVFLMDPDNPKVDTNELLRQRGGKMLDPRAMNHNCPFCNQTMAWDLFMSHAEECFKRWRKVVYRRKRTIGTVIT